MLVASCTLLQVKLAEMRLLHWFELFINELKPQNQAAQWEVEEAEEQTRSRGTLSPLLKDGQPVTNCNCRSRPGPGEPCLLGQPVTSCKEKIARACCKEEGLVRQLFLQMNWITSRFVGIIYQPKKTIKQKCKCDAKPNQMWKIDAGNNQYL